MDRSVVVTGIKYLFYASIISFVIFLILLIVHYTYTPIFSFLPVATLASDGTQDYANNSLFKDTPATPNTKMTFNPPIVNMNKDKFTFSFDCFLNGTYRSTTVPRVVAYFGTSPVNVANNNDLREFHTTTKEIETPKLLTRNNSDLLVKFTNTNFIVYVDPVKNDMKVGVFTVDRNDTTKKYLEIGSIIPNIPINQPFQITLVLGSSFLEVYKDRKLVNTHRIGSLSPTRSVLNSSAIPSADYGIYTPISFIGDTIKIGNVQFYNGPLTGSQIRDLINPLKPATFFR